jgi:acetyltransferase-like isoleucine patch superfamily enzyme
MFRFSEVECSFCGSISSASKIVEFEFFSVLTNIIHPSSLCFYNWQYWCIFSGFISFWIENSRTRDFCFCFEFVGSISINSVFVGDRVIVEFSVFAESSVVTAS